jgi:hypothetical protein
MSNQKLKEFIKKARKKGYDDLQIKELLLSHNWPLEELEKAFSSLKIKYKFKNKISIFLDSGIIKILDKRAKKNLLTLPEQIEDIIRRSCITAKKRNKQDEKLDDILVSLFSRKR